ncbi:alpha-amylase family protein [Glaciecola sp. MH2013]|uniref:alpha-amylase family protein n=1 Tax=Glaciecola sp. MH2013 TaxID=2785524 RepID=UPI00189EAB57|nr:alpha-amylase family protein [Glaciecola sp. MH2013]MBF7073385.1 alpha-amylase family protein [Glaciecola sp. MH2013]
MNLEFESKKSLKRILSQLDLGELSAVDKRVFLSRLNTHFPPLFTILYEVYGGQYDFFYHLQSLVEVLKSNFVERKASLKKKDKERTNLPTWFKSEKQLGMACYVDLFAGDLKKLQQQIPYLQELGITYIHLMPLYKSPEGDSDGGYAVSDYRCVDPKLGSIDDLKKLGAKLAKAGISLVLDFVFNHTSDEHHWARLAKEGKQEYQQFYWMFDSKDETTAYEEHLREIFPQVRRGNFSFDKHSQKWVWTTFNNFQWDLNYSNPAVFNAITDEMLFLANVGCDALRLDALAFIWKEMGTNCENQPKAHLLIQGFNRCLKIVAPAVAFKSEAIVHPDEVVKYIDKDECELSYNPLLMALIWNSLATRKTKLLTKSMQKSFSISDQCAWVNYARCHDDIGWTFDDNVAVELGINAFDHRLFLNQFYTGRFDGSFAKGVAFAENTTTGDCRVCGSLASLAGLEQAMDLQDEQLIAHAIKRVLLIHGVILSIGGIPLLYSGDELGLLNDYSFAEDDTKVHDERWVHRVAVDEKSIRNASNIHTPQHSIAKGLEKLIKIRKEHVIFGDSPTHILNMHNDHIFAFMRKTKSKQGSDEQTLIALFNFSEQRISVSNLQTTLATQAQFDTVDEVKVTEFIHNKHYEALPNTIEIEALDMMWFHLQA